MRKISFLPALMLVGLTACNNAGDKPAGGSDTPATAGHDTSMHMAANTGNVPPLPEIPAGAKVYFKNLKDGQTVSSPVKVEMGIDSMKVDTANGPIVAGTGHHHLLIDAGDSIPAGTPVPKDSTHLHFGKGQTSTEVKLTPGQHLLTLQFADAAHRSYGSKLATTIKVTVK